MAKYAGAILTIAGAIIGAYFGGPFGASLGAAIGGLTGTLLFPQNTTSYGPRLSDTSSTVSNVGAPIPRGWGTFPAGGCIIVQTDLQEVIESSSVGGKGGPSETTETPTYFQSFAIGINDGIIGGIRVIWANGKPIYDLRPQGQAASSDNSIFLTSPEEGSNTAETDAQYQARIVASQQLASKFTLYLGTNSQMPDPTLEAFYGVGNVGAFRDLAYIVFTDWQNKPEDGNRMPSQWKFEVYNEATGTTTNGGSYRNEVLYPWIPTTNPLNPCNTHTYQAVAPGGAGPIRATEAAAINDCEPTALGLSYLDYCPVSPTAGLATNLTGGPDITETLYREVTTVYLHYNDVVPKFFGALPDHGYGSDNTCYYFNSILLPSGVTIARIGEADRWNYDATAGVVYGIAPSFATDMPGPDVYGPLGWDRVVSCGGHIGDLGGFGNDIYESIDRVLEVVRTPSAPPQIYLDDGMGNLSAPPCIDIATPIPGIDGWGVLDGELVKAGPWSLYTASGGNYCLVLQAYKTGSSLDGEAIVTSYPRDPALPDGHDDFYNAEYWEDAYSQAVIQGLVNSGKTYVSGGSATNADTEYPHRQASIYEDVGTLTSQTVGVANVSDIFSDICKEAGLQDADIDVTVLTGKQVIGYVRSNVMAARDAITPLTQALFFNAIESDAKISCRLLGTGIVLTLKQEELGATVMDGSTSQSITSLQSVDAQDVDLPRSIRVHYLSQSRDYEAGEQDSPFRVGTAAVNDVDMQLPIVMDDDQALQIAQKMWAQQWAERITYSTTIDAEHQELEPVDDIAVPVDGATQSVRITAISDALPATRALTMVSTDLESFVSTAVASPVPAQPRPILIDTPAKAIMLDVPLLRDQDNDSGFYTALIGLLPDSFKSAALYRSTDNGGNFTRLISTGTTAITGELSQALPSGPTSIFDEGNALYVDLYDSTDTLTSATQADVLGGANAAAIGADGRWEIIQFKSATHQAGNIYKLTGLLRGRRGTEWAVGTSQAGDEFVLLTGVVRTPLDLTMVNKTYQYKPVGSGSTLDEAITETFTGHGVALKPFSPCYFKASHDVTSGTWTFTWIRRGRIGQTLQSGVDVPLSESSEDYELDIQDSLGNVKRTLSTSTPSVAYTSDQQETDFGSAQSTVRAQVYQVSAQIGRGYGTFATFS